jgi:hypothetical protein
MPGIEVSQANKLLRSLPRTRRSQSPRHLRRVFRQNSALLSPGGLKHGLELRRRVLDGASDFRAATEGRPELWSSTDLRAGESELSQG